MLIPEHAIQEIEELICNLKMKYGGTTDSPLHCRELFHNDARSKSKWAHISEQSAIELCGDILRGIAKFEPKYLLGFIPSEYYPKRFRLIGKNGHPDLVHNVDTKWLTLWAYFRIAAILDPVEIITPHNPILNPRPRNLPFWRMISKRSEPGMKVRKVFLDRESQKIRWFSKSFKWTTVAKELVIETPAFKSHLPIEETLQDKHLLIELADIFTYSNARALSQGREIVYRDFQGEVYVQVICGEGEEIILGGTN